MAAENTGTPSDADVTVPDETRRQALSLRDVRVTDSQARDSLVPLPESRISRTLRTLAALGVLLALLKLSASLIVPLLLAALVAAAVSPVVRWASHYLPRAASVAFAIVVGIAAVSLLGWLTAASAQDLVGSAAQYAQSMNEAKGELARWLGHANLHGAAHSVAQTDIETWITAQIAPSVGALTEGIGTSLVVGLITIFALLESATFRTKLELLGRLDASWNVRENLRTIQETVSEIQKYLVVKTAISAATGLCVGVLCAAFGLENPVLYGVLAFALNYVPNIGSAIATIFPVIVAWATLGWPAALAILVGSIVINMVLGNVLEPKIAGRVSNLSPLVVIVSVIVWGWILGPLGAVMSVPLTIILRIVTMRRKSTRWIAILLAEATSLDRMEERCARRDAGRPSQTEPLRPSIFP
jgi:predicted PurR-regulated permease PerM